MKIETPPMGFLMSEFEFQKFLFYFWPPPLFGTLSKIFPLSNYDASPYLLWSVNKSFSIIVLEERRSSLCWWILQSEFFSRLTCGQDGPFFKVIVKCFFVLCESWFLCVLAIKLLEGSRHRCSSRRFPWKKCLLKHWNGFYITHLDVKHP